MEPENPTPVPVVSQNETAPVEMPIDSALSPQSGAAPAPEPGSLHWMFMGSQGLRAGWSIAIFFTIVLVPVIVLRLIAQLVQKAAPQAAKASAQSQSLSPWMAIFGELIQVLLLLLVVFIMSLIERRKLLDYNLRGPRQVFHFSTGLLCGFVALSALVGSLVAGGWLHFGPVALSGGQIVMYAAVWGATFLLVGCFEEGLMRCYLLFTFGRGLNFWWAAGFIACVCGLLIRLTKGEGSWGAYILALAGIVPCLLLQLRKSPGVGFWNAAWVTSFLFGAMHTGNNGENWIGIFAAGAIGFVFCVSVRLTGSAWWAIGCHAAWDWGETYFYGTADSGMVAKGHLLSTSPMGSTFWSGGADGPEGSVLVLGIILLLLIVVVAAFGRKRAAVVATVAMESAAG
ncbi:MAG TPA: CPBP family intramembrane glutamic endopeptidase [Terracidiphilus sp.]|jgi:hypothetical protein